MQTMSYLGDGDLYFYTIVIVWSMGIWKPNVSSLYEANYFSLTLVMAVGLSNILKSVFHSSRPYFDDILLGDTVMRDCAAEFGNPSGHSLLAVSFCLNILWFYHDQYKDFFKKHSFLKMLSYFTTAFFIVSVIYSRIYTGRHSIDQCINGFLLGFWVAHFSYNYWRTHVFEVDIHKDSDHWLQWSIYASLFACYMIVTLGLYFYIETNVSIPEQWFNSAQMICDRLSEGHMFHYSTVACCGHLSFILTFYTHKAYKSSIGQPVKLRWESGDVETRSSFLESVLRVFTCVVLDYIMTSFAPMQIYGTKRMSMVPDLILKKLLNITFLCLIINSQTYDKALKSIFRQNLLKSEFQIEHNPK
jgi:membrane-associated phospholipid phosphatase